MGNNIAPIGVLPGDTLPVDKGDMCDREGHENRVAVLRVVGETDSHGSETECLCQECADAWRAQPEEGIIDTCEWCKKTDTLFHTRDTDEGMSGSVYMVCYACRSEQNKRDQEELDAISDDDYYN